MQEKIIIDAPDLKKVEKAAKNTDFQSFKKSGWIPEHHQIYSN